VQKRHYSEFFDRDAVVLVITNPVICKCGRAITRIVLLGMDGLDAVLPDIQHTCGCGRAYAIELVFEEPFLIVKEIGRKAIIAASRRYSDDHTN